MESNRIDHIRIDYPKIRLDNDVFNFVFDLEVGQKGLMNFSGTIKAHEIDTNDNLSDDEKETKTIRFTNIIPFRLQR